MIQNRVRQLDIECGQIDRPVRPEREETMVASTLNITEAEQPMLEEIESSTPNILNPDHHMLDESIDCSTRGLAAPIFEGFEHFYQTFSTNYIAIYIVTNYVEYQINFT